MEKKLGSILCDGGENEDYRADITLEDGRLYCDGNDITPHSGRYTNEEDAIKDISALYACAVWELEIED